MRFGMTALPFCMVLCLIFPSQPPPWRARQGGTDPQRIEWTRDRKLQWRDFAMKAPAGSSDDCHSWVGFDTAWTCDRSGFVFHVRTSFNPSQSWVRPGSQDDSLLRHEQMHFDLTELAARQLRKGLGGLDDPCRSSVTMDEIDRVIATQRQSWEQEQKLYDRETANGTNENRQRYWDQTTQRRLDELKGFE
jgi:hypothetical protein